jgi:anaerobic magnesium-protoporphyrin IX monomethyl ester cyclase
MRVAMVYPEVYDVAKFERKRKEFPPFGIMYLAAEVERQGVDVKVFSVSPDSFALDLRDYEAVAFSTPSSVTYPLIKAARFGSTYGKSPLIMVGGMHASLYPRQTLTEMKANVLGVGEGETTILEVLGAHESRDFSKIEGVYYWDEQQPVFTSPRPLISNIDSLPFPARHLMNVNDIIMDDRLAKTNTRMTHIMLSRGCPYSCHFCASPQKIVQYRSGISIRRELISLMDNYGIEGFSVVDDNSILRKELLYDICQSIRDLSLSWSTVSRVDTVDSDALGWMRESGCIEIAFGVESGSQKMLNAMNKKITIEQIKRAITLAHSSGIGVKVFIVHGFPGENLETTNETIDLLSQLANMIQRVSLFRFVPLPGSFVYKNRQLYGIHLPNDNSGVVDWTKFHIHHNHYHWWGTVEDFSILNVAYNKLKGFVNNIWTSRYD